MMQFTLKAMLLFVALAAVACTVLFALPEGVQIVVLLVGVVALPGPLVVAFLRGGRRVKSFAVGGLAAYAVWLVVIAIPVSYNVTSQLNSYLQVSWSAFRVSPVPSYTSLAALKLPWLMVLAAGLISLAVDWLVSDRPNANRN